MQFAISKDGQTNVNIDVVTQSFFIKQLAANILFTLNRCEYDSERDEVFLLNSPSETLAAYANWASHGFLNAFQYQVSFIYNFLCEIQTKELAIRLFLNEETIITLRALKEYQIRKTSWITNSKKRHGENWGDATGYNNMNWSDQNERILELLGYPKDHKFYTELKCEVNPHGGR